MKEKVGKDRINAPVEVIQRLYFDISELDLIYSWYVLSCSYLSWSQERWIADVALDESDSECLRIVVKEFEAKVP